MPGVRINADAPPSLARASLDSLQRSAESIQLAPIPRSSLASLPVPTSGSSSQQHDDGLHMGIEVLSSFASVRNEMSLAPVDGGFGAWTFLAGAFVVEALVWGFPNAFGLFLEAYLSDPKFASQPHAASLLPLIGPLSSGIIYCSGPVIYPFASRYPHHRRTSMWVGTLFCWTSLFGASYATKVEQLIALQGVLYAIGGSLLYAPCISYMSEWFVKRRGLANGVIFAGTALGGLLLPLILPTLFRHYGLAHTLRYLSISVLVCLLMVLPFIKPRLPETRVHGPARRNAEGREWVKSWTWWTLVVANTVQGFAYFVPIVWLPTYASALNASSSTSSLALAFLNGASVVGRLLMGVLSDHVSPWLLGLMTLAATSLSTFVLWGVAGHTVAGVMVFGATYGMLAGGWSSLWTGFVRPIAKDDPTLSTTLFGFLMLSRGIGNVLSTPISTALSAVVDSADVGHLRLKTGFEVAGGRFEKVIVYVGTCFAGAAVVALVGMGAERVGVKRRVGPA